MSSSKKNTSVEIGLNAAIVALDAAEPLVLTVSETEFDHGNESEPDQDFLALNDSSQEISRPLDGLPFGRFDPLTHRTMDIGVRGFVKSQTGLDVGYVEQLYTFGDRGRAVDHSRGEVHVVSIGYLALTKTHDQNPEGALWRRWYQGFPWEDWRSGEPALIGSEIIPRLETWCSRHTNAALRRKAFERLNKCFTTERTHWDEEMVLERYELLYEAGLVFEALRDERSAAKKWDALTKLGDPMKFDHRRILATAMSRIRAKIKYRPVIFELMPSQFTLLQLQRSVEAISGTLLHKQNFRRLVEQGGLVVATNEVSQETGGRPAKLYRFREEILLERTRAGVR